LPYQVKSALYITVGKFHRRYQSRICDADAMMDLIAFLEAAHDRKIEIFNRWFVNLHRLKTAFESFVLFNVFAIFNKGRWHRYSAGRRAPELV
jgi:hypothetical protein